MVQEDEERRKKMTTHTMKRKFININNEEKMWI